LTPREGQLLRLILRHQVMPSLSSIPEHEELGRQAGFTAIRTADWSGAVSNSWDPAFALTPPVERGNSYMMELARGRGVDVLGFFYAGPLMKEGYDSDVIRYGVLRANKPARPGGPT
jgi:tocopherol O-methyltransferase